MNTEITSDLIDRYFDGRASRSEQEELGRRIADDGETAAEFVRASRMQAALEQQFAEARDRSEARVEITALLAKRGKATQRAATLEALQVRWQGWRRRGATAAAWVWQRPAVAGAAALVTAGAIFLAVRPAGKAPPALADSPASASPASGTAGFDPDGGSVTAAPAPLLARDVKRKLGRFYLPGVDIAPLPIEDALALLTREFEGVAKRHRDATAKRIALRLGDKLGASDPRRQRLVSLASRSITAGNALQLLAGQAGLTVAYVDGAAELRPQLPGAAPLRTRTLDVPEDFLARVGSMFAGTGTEINPLAMLSFQPPPGAAAHLYPDGQGMAKLSVQATPDDLRSITALAAMMKPGSKASIQLTTKVFNLPSETLDELHAAASSRSNAIADILAAVASPLPADQIIANPAEVRQLLASIKDLPGAVSISAPSVIAAADESVHIGGPHTPLDAEWALSLDATMQAVTENALAAARSEFEDVILFDPFYKSLVDGVATGAVDIEVQKAVGALIFNPGDEVNIITTEEPAQDVTDIVVGARSADSELVITTTVEHVDREVTDVVGLVNQPQWTAGIGTQVILDAESLADWITHSPSRRDADLTGLVQPPSTPGYSSNMIARLEGEAVRVTGTMAYTATPPDLLASMHLEPWGFPVHPAPTPSLDNDGDGHAVDRQAHNTIQRSRSYMAPRAAAASNEVDFDATIAAGQTLLLEIDGDNGGKQIVLLTAEKR